MSATNYSPSDLDGLVASWLDVRWHFDPVEATAQGLTEHDGRFGDLSEAGVKERLAALNSLMHAVEELSVDDLEDEIDRTALLNDIRFTIHRFGKEKPHRRDPGFWLSHALDGLYLLLVLRDRTPEQRSRAVVDRMRALPGFLQCARESLDSCPRTFVHTAMEVARGGATLIDQLAADLPAGPESGMEAAIAGARSALEDFHSHLAGPLTTGSTEDFAVGEDAFNYRLAVEHAVGTTASELWRYGAELIESTHSELARRADAIAPGVAWADLAERLRDEHPSADGLVEAYSDAMERACSFVEERGIAPVPEAPLEVMETPPFLRPVIPFAAYQSPGAFSADRTGRFFVSPPRGSGEAAARALRDHCVHEIPVTALHEGFPGHHLQFLSAQAQPRALRKVSWSAVTVEGWALYCEEMMGEEGFYSRPEERFFQQLALLFRAVRILLDVGLHARGMSAEQAVDILVDRLQFDRAHAEAEVRRYCATPAYQVAYAVGRRELLSLRDAYQGGMGADYSLRKFHDAVLGYGGLPVSLMRWGMGA